MNDLVTWLRAQLDEDEAWARAACQPYPYGTDRTMPDGGVHWQWVVGEVWEPTTPDPVVNEFVAEPGYGCNLATVEVWPTDRPDRPMPQTYANDIIEMDSSAAGHIARHDPARVLAEVEAKRRILDAESGRWQMRSDVRDLSWEAEWPDRVRVKSPVGRAFDQVMTEVEFQEGYMEPCLPSLVVKLLALPYADQPGYDESWRP